MNEKLDFSELEKAIRVIAPPAKYGYLDYFLSDSCKIVFDKGMNPFFSDDFKLERGYNCMDVNNFVSIVLSKYGIANNLVHGKDAYGIFGNHFYCLTEGTNMVFDAVPMFSFVGAAHPTPKGVVEYFDAKYFRFCENPVAVFCNDGESHLLTFSTGIVTRIGTMHDFWEKSNYVKSSGSGLFNFTLSDTNLSTEKISTDAYIFDPAKYKKRFKAKSVPVLSESIDDLEDSGIITRFDVTERHYLSFTYSSSKMDEEFKAVHRTYPSLMGNILHKLAYGVHSDQTKLVNAKANPYRASDSI